MAVSIIRAHWNIELSISQRHFRRRHKHSTNVIENPILLNRQSCITSASATRCKYGTHTPQNIVTTEHKIRRMIILANNWANKLLSSREWKISHKTVNIGLFILYFFLCLRWSFIGWMNEYRIEIAILMAVGSLYKRIFCVRRLIQ